MGDPSADVYELRADCERCVGLCCVAPRFSVSADFAIDKPAGEPCPNLSRDFRCGIHANLRAAGFPGCASYDCFGAGQRVTGLFAGRDWRGHPENASGISEAFSAMRHLHELLWHLRQASALVAGSPLRSNLERALGETEALAASDSDVLLDLDVQAHHEEVNGLLSRASEQVREGIGGADHRGKDLIGADLRGADLRGANLRGALLVGADLRDADLTLADLTGADLRGADLRGADLSRCLFLTQSQLDSAKGGSGAEPG